MLKINLSLFCVAAALVTLTFNVSQDASHLEDRRHAVIRNIATLEEQKSVLEAEWAYLNDPARLSTLMARVDPAAGQARIIRAGDLSRELSRRPLVVNGEIVMAHVPVPLSRPRAEHHIENPRLAALGESARKPNPQEPTVSLN